jgi:26S proteasome regulatory subunit N1
MAPKDTKEAVDVTVESDKKKDTKKKIDDETPDTMSQEDQELKERLETCVSTVLNEDNEAAVTIPIRQKALDIIVTELRTATASMTSVPKPLKFLRPHFADIKQLHVDLARDATPDNATRELRARLADVLAVLAMTMGNHGKRDRLICDR